MTLPSVQLLHNDQPVPFRAGAWQVTEAAELRIVTSRPCRLNLDGRALHWDADERGVRVQLPFAVGRLTLTVHQDDHSASHRIDVTPAETKVGAALWTSLLTDLDAWLPGVLGGVEGPRRGGLDLLGRDLPSAVEAVLPLVPVYLRAIRAVCDQPRRIEEQRLSERSIHHAQRATAATLAWISRHPREAAWLHPESDADLVGPPPVIPVDTYRDTLNHPANRHIVWQMGRVAMRLETAARQLAQATASDLNNTRAWRTARCTALNQAAEALHRQLRTGPLRTVRPAPASQQALLVLLDDPRYAHVHRLGRRLLKSGLLGTTGAQVATRPSYHLYELWCFLAVQRALQRQLGTQWTWRLRKRKRLLGLAGSGSDARWEATRPSGNRITIWFNPRFRGYLTASDHTGRHSITRERRPDVCVTAGPHWIALDAKYRVGHSALADAFTSAHLYRDALRWPAHGGRPVAAWLLSPRADAQTGPWFDETFAHTHAVGAVALTPGADHSTFAARLIHALRMPA